MKNNFVHLTCKWGTSEFTYTVSHLCVMKLNLRAFIFFNSYTKNYGILFVFDIIGHPEHFHAKQYKTHVSLMH